MSEVVVHPTEGGDLPAAAPATAEATAAAVAAGKHRVAALETELAARDVELRRALEERQLLLQLRTVDEMALAKIEADGGGSRPPAPAAARMKISEDSVAKIVALKDELKRQTATTAGLQQEVVLLQRQSERTEAAIAEQESLLAVVEDSTGYCSTPGKGGKPFVAQHNLFMIQKRQLVQTELQQRAAKATMHALTLEIDRLTVELERRKAVEDRTADARAQLQRLEQEDKEKREALQQLRRITQRKEKLLSSTVKQDDIAALRLLEGDKRVLHSDLSKQLDMLRVSQKAILSNDDRLQKIESKLDTVAAFLASTFADVPDDDATLHRPEGTAADAAAVPIVEFDRLVADLVVLRRTLEQRDRQLEGLDAQVESSEKKVDIVHVAQVSRTAVAAQEFQEMEHERRRLVSNVDLIGEEYHTEQARLEAERERLEMLLAA